MANIKSSKKAIKVIAKKTENNHELKARVKNLTMCRLPLLPAPRRVETFALSFLFRPSFQISRQGRPGGTPLSAGLSGRSGPYARPAARCSRYSII